MKGLKMRFTASMTLAATASLLATPMAFAGGSIEVGSETSHEFRSAPINGMGITSLKALRGKPVLVEFWGTK